jgi:hypothetical protein
VYIKRKNFKGSVMNIEFIAMTQFKRKRFAGYVFGGIIIIFSLVFTWGKFGYPKSFNEAVLLSRLKAISLSNEQLIDLSKFMSNEWELVCESHGYDEPLFLSKYNKTFPTTGAMHDGAWGLIFINKDGTFDSAASSCSSGIVLKFSDIRCLPRAQAILHREKKLDGSTCAVFIV